MLPLALEWEHARVAGGLPLHHRDPFDRMLVAQAMVERLTIVTRDEAIRRYTVPVIAA
jgi:PIN domain nuclease of toxin-antitoxin system